MTLALPAAVGWRLVPSCCVLCEARGMLHRLDLCRLCHETLPRDEWIWRPGPPPFNAVLAPWRYRYPVDAMIRALKFHGECSYARVFGQLLARERQQLDGAMPDLLVPLPLHPRRRVERGYNQAAELARHAGRQLRLEVGERWLHRVRPTREQTSLAARARRANVHNAFHADAAVNGRRVALLDDVVTTGSTAGAAARALLQAGAAAVELWVVARASRRDGRQA